MKTKDGLAGPATQNSSMTSQTQSILSTDDGQINSDLAAPFQSELFNEIEYLTSDKFELNVFLERLIDQILGATNTLSATLLLLDEAGENLEFCVVKGPNSEKLKGTFMRANEGIAGNVISTGAPYVSQNVDNDPLWSSRVGKKISYDTVNLIAVPLKLKNITKGVIEVMNKKDHSPFGEQDVALLNALSTKFALALEYSRHLSEARQRAKEFETLSKLSTILNSNLDQKTVYQSALESVVELMDCETGSLYLIDKEANELYYDVVLGDKGEAIKKHRLKLGEGIAGWVAQEERSDLVVDVNVDPRWAKSIDEKSSFETKNLITVPIRTKKEVIGVLQAINKRNGKIPQRADLRLLERLSDQVAIALENSRLYEAQKRMFTETALAMATAIEKRDPYTGDHTKRVRQQSMAIAKYLDLPSESLEWLELAAILHDTGKIGINDQILCARKKLTAAEFDIIKQHPDIGKEILQQVKALEPIFSGVKYHHERFDGTGYPQGLEKDGIPLIARIIAVADAWDAMTSDRPYRDRLPEAVVLKEMQKFSGTQFDPEVVDAFLKAYHQGEIVSSQSAESTREKEK